MTTMPGDIPAHKAPATVRAQSQKGNALVEFALILPFFLALIFGMVTFSIALYNKTVLTMATREGARAGAVYVAGETDDTHITARARSAARLACRNKIITFGTNYTDQQYDEMVPAPTIGGVAPNRILTVTANITTYTGLFWGFFIGSNPNTQYPISAISIMKLE